MVISDNSIRIDQIVSGPVFIRKSFPDGVAVIDGYRVGDVQVVYRLPDVSDVFFERKFRRVHTQHGEPAVAVLLEPCPHVRNGSQAIDARVRPEIDEHHAPANIGRSEWRRIEPGARARKARHGAFVRRWRGPSRSDAVDQSLFEAGCPSQRDPRQHTGIQPQCNSGDAGEYHDADTAAYPPLAL